MRGASQAPSQEFESQSFALPSIAHGLSNNRISIHILESKPSTSQQHFLSQALKL